MIIIIKYLYSPKIDNYINFAPFVSYLVLIFIKERLLSETQNNIMNNHKTKMFS